MCGFTPEKRSKKVNSRYSWYEWELGYKPGLPHSESVPLATTRCSQHRVPYEGEVQDVRTISDKWGHHRHIQEDHIGLQG